MARSPSDATRFTSTGPYASSSFTSHAPGTSSTASRIDFGTAPAGETPQQKITRLRAAAQLAKRGQETTFDKTVRIGRIWADRAHRVTALGLIGFTVLTTAVAAAGITDMLMHNRRKRNEWLEAKQIESARELASAKRAESEGQATEEQILLINRERAAMEAEFAKRNRPGVFTRASNWLFSGLSKQEQAGGRMGAAAAATKRAGSEFVEDGKSVLQQVEDKLDQHRRQGEVEVVEKLSRPSGGPLDRQAQSAVDSARNASRGWTSWITGR